MTHYKAHIRTIANQDGAAVLDIQKGTISTLNTTGAYIWQALQRGESEKQIVEGLARQTDESPDVIRQDVNSFIIALHQQKILDR